MLVPHAFGSVIFLLGALEDKARQQYLKRAGRWLEEWLKWFLHHNGVLSGRNLHLLYDRSVSVLGQGALAGHHEISRLGAVARSHGATFSSELYLTDCLRKPAAYRELLDGGTLQSVILIPRAVRFQTTEQRSSISSRRLSRRARRLFCLARQIFGTALASWSRRSSIHATFASFQRTGYGPPVPTRR
jgi:hypothetical protein